MTRAGLAGYLLVVTLVGACATPGAVQLPSGERVSGDKEHVLVLHRWQPGDTFRYTLLGRHDVGTEDAPDAAESRSEVRCSARRATARGLVEVTVFVDDAEVGTMFFDGDGRLADATSLHGGDAPAFFALVNMWSILGRAWPPGPITAGERHWTHVPLDSLFLFLPHTRLPQPDTLAARMPVGYRIAGFQVVQEQRTVVVETHLPNLLASPLPLRVPGAGRLTLSAIGIDRTYYLDATRGFIVAVYAVTQYTGTASGRRTEARTRQSLTWKGR